MTEKQAKALRAVLVQGGASLSDAVISTAPEACQRMKYDGALIKNGTRINWNGTVKRAAVDLWDTPRKRAGYRSNPLGGYPVQAGIPHHPGGHHRRPGLCPGGTGLVGRQPV